MRVIHQQKKNPKNSSTYSDCVAKCGNLCTIKSYPCSAIQPAPTWKAITYPWKSIRVPILQQLNGNKKQRCHVSSHVAFASRNLAFRMMIILRMTATSAIFPGSLSFETLKEGIHGGIKAYCWQSCDVKCIAHLLCTARNHAFATHQTVIAIKWGNANQLCNLPFVE